MGILESQEERQERLKRTLALMFSDAKSHKCKCGTMIFLDAEEEQAFKDGRLQCAICGEILRGAEC